MSSETRQTLHILETPLAEENHRIRRQLHGIRREVPRFQSKFSNLYKAPSVSRMFSCTSTGNMAYRWCEYFLSCWFYPPSRELSCSRFVLGRCQTIPGNPEMTRSKLFQSAPVKHKKIRWGYDLIVWRKISGVQALWYAHSNLRLGQISQPYMWKSNITAIVTKLNEAT